MRVKNESTLKVIITFIMFALAMKVVFELWNAPEDTLVVWFITFYMGTMFMGVATGWMAKVESARKSEEFGSHVDDLVADLKRFADKVEEQASNQHSEGDDGNRH